MITLCLFVAQAFSKNPKFNPQTLYLGTIILDLEIIARLIK